MVKCIEIIPANFVGTNKASVAEDAQMLRYCRAADGVIRRDIANRARSGPQ